jgi:predicted MFS family arabinose efflux permease
MTMLANLAERRGIQSGYTSSLINLAWAPGQTAGAVGGGVLAHAAGDAAPYLVLSGICALTLVTIWPSRRSTAWTTLSAPESSGSSSHTTAAV